MILLAGCPPAQRGVPCEADTDCGTHAGGVCTLAETGNRWCAYSDTDCPSGYRYSDYDTEEAINGLCVPGSWIKQLGSAGDDFGTSIAVDSRGDLVAVGSFSQTITLAPGIELPSTNENNIYIIKLSSSTGNVIWTKHYGVGMYGSPFDVAIDSSDEIYVFGAFFSDAIDLGSGPKRVTITGNNGMFVLKLRANGEHAWDEVFEAKDSLSPSIAVHGDSVALVGTHRGSMMVDGTPYNPPGNTDPFSTIAFAIVKSASTGMTTWAKVYGGESSSVRANDVAIDNDNNVVLVGDFFNSVSFAPGRTLSSAGNRDGFLAKLALDGTHLLSMSIGLSVGNDGASAVALDPTNNIFVTGFFGFTGYFGCPNPLTASVQGDDVNDLFLAKYSPAGRCEWANGYVATSSSDFSSDISDVVTNSSGEIAITGAFSPPISLGGEQLRSSGFDDIFVARFNGDGMHLSSFRAGGISTDGGASVAQGAEGRLFVTGHFRDVAEFDSFTLTTEGQSDSFIASFAPL